MMMWLMHFLLSSPSEVPYSCEGEGVQEKVAVVLNVHTGLFVSPAPARLVTSSLSSVDTSDGRCSHIPACARADRNNASRTMVLTTCRQQISCTPVA